MVPYFAPGSSLQEPAPTAISTLSATSPEKNIIPLKNRSVEPTYMMEPGRAGSKVMGLCKIEVGPFKDCGGVLPQNCIGWLEHSEASFLV